MFIKLVLSYKCRYSATAVHYQTFNCSLKSCTRIFIKPKICFTSVVTSHFHLGNEQCYNVKYMDVFWLLVGYLIQFMELLGDNP